MTVWKPDYGGPTAARLAWQDSLSARVRLSCLRGTVEITLPSWHAPDSVLLKSAVFCGTWHNAHVCLVAPCCTPLTENYAFNPQRRDFALALAICHSSGVESHTSMTVPPCVTISTSVSSSLAPLAFLGGCKSLKQEKSKQEGPQPHPRPS